MTVTVRVVTDAVQVDVVRGRDTARPIERGPSGGHASAGAQPGHRW